MTPFFESLGDAVAMTLSTPIDRSSATRMVAKNAGVADRRLGIERFRLIDELLADGEKQITLITAAFGYGKSVLLAQLARRLARTGHECIKVSVSTRTAGSTQLRSLLDKRPRDCATGRRGDAKRYLLLDDYHRVRSPAVDSLLERLLSSWPAGSRIIAMSRPTSVHEEAGGDGPAFRFLTEDWLRFDADEITSLCRDIPAFVGQDALFARMHGWPTGCAIVGAIAVDCPTLPGPMIAARVSNAIEQHLDDVLGPEFDEEGWQLAERLSLDVAGPGPLGGAAMDAACLLHDHGLAETIDGDLATIHLRQPFDDIVRARFQRRNPRRYLDEVGAAAARLVASGQWDACRPLLTKVPIGLRAHLLEELGGWILDVRFGPHLFSEFELELDGRFDDLPRLQLARAIELARRNRPSEAQWLMSRLANRFAFASEDKRLWLAEFAINRLRIAMFADQVIQPQELEAVEILQHQDLSACPVLYAVAAGVLSDVLYRQGHYQQCRESGLRGIVLCDHYHAPYVAAYVFAVTALAEFRLGNLGSAIQLTERMSTHAAQTLAAHRSVQDMAAVISAVMRYESGDIDAAEAMLDRELGIVLENEGWLEVGIAGFFTAANIAVRRRELDRALDIVMLAEEVGTRLGFTRLAEIAQCRALFLLSTMDRVGEAALLQSRDYFPSGEADDDTASWRNYLSTTHVVASCAYHLARGDHATALLWLDKYLSEPGSTQNVPTYVRLCCLKMLAICALNRPIDEIASSIRTLHFYVEKRGFVSPLLEFPQLEVALRQSLSLPGLACDVHRLANLLIDRLELAAPADDSARRSLSPRQTQILGLLSDGLSNKEIASRLGLAEGTVKSYRKVLYQKLDISRRSQAVARARTRSATPF